MPAPSHELLYRRLRNRFDYEGYEGTLLDDLTREKMQIKLCRKVNGWKYVNIHYQHEHSEKKLCPRSSIVL